VIPINLEAPNGAIRSAQLTLKCITEEVKISDIENNATNLNIIGNLRTCNRSVYFVFDDDPRPRGLNKMWLLSIANECPYNNSHEIGLGVVEVEDTSSGNKKTTFVSACSMIEGENLTVRYLKGLYVSLQSYNIH
jgi:hypothetical protein